MQCQFNALSHIKCQSRDLPNTPAGPTIASAETADPMLESKKFEEKNLKKAKDSGKDHHMFARDFE